MLSCKAKKMVPLNFYKVLGNLLAYSHTVSVYKNALLYLDMENRIQHFYLIFAASQN